MLAHGIVGELLIGDRQPERPAQDCLTKAQRLAIKVGADKRLDDGNVGFVRHLEPHGLLASCSTMAQIAAIWGASLPR